MTPMTDSNMEDILRVMDDPKSYVVPTWYEAAFNDSAAAMSPVPLVSGRKLRNVRVGQGLVETFGYIVKKTGGVSVRTVRLHFDSEPGHVDVEYVGIPDAPAPDSELSGYLSLEYIVEQVERLREGVNRGLISGPVTLALHRDGHAEILHLVMKTCDLASVLDAKSP